MEFVKRFPIIKKRVIALMNFIRTMVFTKTTLFMLKIFYKLALIFIISVPRVTQKEKEMGLYLLPAR